MIIAISGTPGSGKSTVAKELARRLKLKHYSVGGYMRDMAEERKISLLELSEIAEKDMGIDEELDRWQIDLGRNEDDFVIDGRLSWHFIPKSIKIFLNADEKTRALRIMADKIRKEHNVNSDTAIANMRRREESERKRYKGYYSLDPNDEKNYYLVIDATNITAEQVVEKIIEFLKDRKI